jgi:transposase
MFIMVVMEQQRRPRRSFPDEYKAQVVELCRSGERSVGAVAKDLDLSETAVRRLIAQAEIDAGHGAGLTSAEREELARLRRENRTLRAERDILKRAAAFFARETR